MGERPNRHQDLSLQGKGRDDRALKKGPEEERNPPRNILKGRLVNDDIVHTDLYANMFRPMYYLYRIEYGMVLL